jgi:hypothetical protein
VLPPVQALICGMSKFCVGNVWHMRLVMQSCTVGDAVFIKNYRLEGHGRGDMIDETFEKIGTDNVALVTIRGAMLNK